MNDNHEITALRAAVQTYFDGVYEADADKLEQVFLPSAALTQVFDGEVKITPRDEWLVAVRGRAKPKDAGMLRDDHVLTLDLIGPTLAHVKVRCQLQPRYFTDLLSFVKHEGRWRIAQKVFMTTVRE
ncbi:MAG: nuclear transport factor 2 family protein [Bosea sp. (in: a-proteobacteria)]